ncbi:hypothetical protein SK128_022125, partial [Halocaridina rubra]
NCELDFGLPFHRVQVRSRLVRWFQGDDFNQVVLRSCISCGVSRILPFCNIKPVVKSIIPCAQA